MTNSIRTSAAILTILFLAISSFVAAMPGCAVNTYETGGPTSNVDLRRVIRDSGLASDVVVDAARIDERAGSKLGQITVRNAGSSTRKIEVRFAWLDKDGMNKSGNSTTWRPYTLKPGEVEEIGSTSGSTSTDFRVSIRSDSN